MPIILAIGSNLGDRKNNILTAMEKISELAEIISESAIYESKALLKKNSPDEWNKNFYNNAISIKTTLSPIELLNFVKKIEKTMKRDIDATIWSPRIIDIDIILYNNEIIDTEKLTIPHKELFNRLFVLYPLNDIVSNYRIPTCNNTVSELLEMRKVKEEFI